MPCYLGHELLRGVEKQDGFLPLVNWDKLENPTQGFRQSTEYQEWENGLNPIYYPFPRVNHDELKFKKQFDE
ncbi:MAG: hypothetical protein ACYCOO_05195 [Chitinophagaceae bacterium]